MTAYINKLKDSEGNQQLPITHERAVRDDNGTTAETKFQNLEGAMDKAYVSGSDNGMGRITLKKNMVSGVNTLTQSMMQATNTIYVIRYDFTLGEDITVPENCILEFDGGSINGEHTLTGNITIISADSDKIFDNLITIGGSWRVTDVYVSWFGTSVDYYNIVRNVCNLLSSDIHNNIYLDKDIAWNPTKESDALFYINKDDVDLYLGTHTITTNPNNYGGYRNIHVHHPRKDIRIFGGILVGELSSFDFSGIATADLPDYFGGYGVHIMGAKNVTVIDTKIYDMRGDGIEIAEGDPTAYGNFSKSADNILIENVWSDYSGRNGISLTGTSRNVQIKNCRVTNTGQHNASTSNPGVGIDFEITHYDTVSNRNIVIEGCSFDNNLHWDIDVVEPKDVHDFTMSSMVINSLRFAGSFLNATIANCNIKQLKIIIGDGLNPMSLPDNISFNNCLIEDFDNLGDYKYTKYNINFNSCTFTSSTTGMASSHFKSQQAHNFFFNNCVIDYNMAENVPLFNVYDFCKIVLRNCSVKTNTKLGSLSGFAKIISCHIESPSFIEYSFYDTGHDVELFNNFFKITEENTKLFDIWRDDTSSASKPSFKVNVVNNHFDERVEDYYTCTLFSVSGADGYCAVLQSGNTFSNIKASFVGNTFKKVSVGSRMDFSSVPLINDTDINDVSQKSQEGFMFALSDSTKPIIHSGNKFYEADGAVAKVLRTGTFVNKPTATDIYVGFRYFCTDKQTTEGATDGIEIIHKGNDVWVDALGRVVS